MRESVQNDQRDMYSKLRRASKRFPNLIILLANAIVVTMVVITNVYIRSLTTVNIETVEGVKKVAVVKAYYQYFHLLTTTSILIVVTCLSISIYILIYQRRQVEKRLNALTSQFSNVGISKISRDNQLFTDDELVVIDTWNSNVDIIEKQVKDREKYLNLMVHDFKVPIQILKSNVQLYNLKHEENKYINAIHDELLDLERDVLTYLVVEKINHFEKTDLQRCDLKQLFNQVSYRYNGLGFDVLVAIKTEDYVIETDITMLLKIVDNIIENAMKHGCGTWINLAVHDDRIEFINQIDTNDVGDIFSCEKRHLSANGNGLGVEIIKTYANLLGYCVSSHTEDNQFIVTLEIPEKTRLDV